jgi:hypothetical protein
MLIVNTLAAADANLKPIEITHKSAVLVAAADSRGVKLNSAAIMMQAASLSPWTPAAG